jgi:hypothetical protein
VCLAKARIRNADRVVVLGEDIGGDADKVALAAPSTIRRPEVSGDGCPAAIMKISCGRRPEPLPAQASMLQGHRRQNVEKDEATVASLPLLLLYGISRMARPNKPASGIIHKYLTRKTTLIFK